MRLMVVHLRDRSSHIELLVDNWEVSRLLRSELLSYAFRLLSCNCHACLEPLPLSLSVGHLLNIVMIIVLPEVADVEAHLHPGVAGRSVVLLGHLSVSGGVGSRVVALDLLVVHHLVVELTLPLHFD